MQRKISEGKQTVVSAGPVLIRKNRIRCYMERQPHLFTAQQEWLLKQIRLTDYGTSIPQFNVKRFLKYNNKLKKENAFLKHVKAWLTPWLDPPRRLNHFPLETPLVFALGRPKLNININLASLNCRTYFYGGHVSNDIIISALVKLAWGEDG